MNIEKSGIIEEQDVRKALLTIIEFSNKISKLSWSNVKRFIYMILLLTFFAILMSVDKKSFLNQFWVIDFVFLALVALQIFVLQKRKKSQQGILSQQTEMCQNFKNKNYSFTITDTHIFNQFGDIEIKYPIGLIKTCYIYKKNFIFYFKDHFNQFLLFSFDSFNNEEFETLYNFLKKKELLDTKYDVLTSKIEIDLTKELHEKK